LNFIYAVATLMESAVVIAFTLSFSTLLAYGVMNFVIWMMGPRQYNEADARSGGVALSRRLLGARSIDSALRLDSAVRVGGGSGADAEHR
jgi:hypothetical protein